MDERQFNENKTKEASYTQKRDEVQADLDSMKNTEQTTLTKEPSRNIFTQMKDAYDKYTAEKKFEKTTKEHVKKQYEDQIKMARRDRLLAEQQKKMEDKLAYERMSSEERAARTKDKINKFTDKLSAGLGTASQSGFVNRAANVTEKNFGTSRPAGGELPSGDRIARMLGQQGQQSKGNTKYAPASGNSVTNMSGERISSLLGGKSRIPAEQPLKYLPRANVSGSVSNAGKLLGASSVGKRNYAADFGNAGVRGDVTKYFGNVGKSSGKSSGKNVGLSSKEGSTIYGSKATDVIQKSGNINYGDKVNSILGGMKSSPTPLKKSEKKSNVIDVVPQDDSKERLKRMIGF